MPPHPLLPSSAPVSWQVLQRCCGRKSCGHGPPEGRLRQDGAPMPPPDCRAAPGPGGAEEGLSALQPEYRNPEDLCCGSCLQRFGPPPARTEFSENCGPDDAGNHVTHPFKECPPGQCNPNSEELCSPCGGGATAPTSLGSRGGTRRRGRQPVPNKEPCPLTRGKLSVLSSQEPSLPAISSLLWTSEHKVPQQAWPSWSFDLSLVLVLLMTSAEILLLALQRHRRRHHQGKAVQHPYPGLVCNDLNIHTLFSLHLSPPGSLEASEAGDSGKEVPLPPLLGRELPSLESQPLSRLLDELEVLEELIVLLDPEPGPGWGRACGSTRHLAAKYGLPAAWSTSAYSLQPSRWPRWALMEMVVAREPSASLGQIGAHLPRDGGQMHCRCCPSLAELGPAQPSTR
ncbi:IGF-like family receptor 1 isoform X1 [Globicephala melas]|uniref:IGF-like family receptor 1 isoform X1 n=1 Tax=Globicephala melas TaxID=9731 RepID=UPI00122FABBE|nr:IGF-like family receptor 1 isoform X1 [Globicephala melas]